MNEIGGNSERLYVRWHSSIVTARGNKPEEYAPQAQSCLCENRIAHQCRSLLVRVSCSTGITHSLCEEEQRPNTQRGKQTVRPETTPTALERDGTQRFYVGCKHRIAGQYAGLLEQLAEHCNHHHRLACGRKSRPPGRHYRAGGLP